MLRREIREILSSINFKSTGIARVIFSDLQFTDATEKKFNVRFGQLVDTPRGKAYVMGEQAGWLWFWVEGENGISFWDNLTGPVDQMKKSPFVFTPKNEFISKEKLNELFEKDILTINTTEKLSPKASQEKRNLFIKKFLTILLAHAFEMNDLNAAKNILEENNESIPTLLKSIRFGKHNNALLYMLQKKLPKSEKLSWVKLLVENGADPYEPDPTDNGTTSPLSIVIDKNDEECLKILLQSEIDTSNNRYYIGVISNAIQHAVVYKNARLLRLLCESLGQETIKEAFEFRNYNSFDSSLYKAVSQNSYEIAKVLLEFGANPYAKKDNGKSPLELAKEKYFNHNMINLLRTKWVIGPLTKNKYKKETYLVFQAHQQEETRLKDRLNDQEYDQLASLAASGDFYATRLFANAHALNLVPENLNVDSKQLASSLYQEMKDKYKDHFAAIQLDMLNNTANSSTLQHAFQVALHDPYDQEITKKWFSKLAQSNHPLAKEAQRFEFEFLNLKIAGKANLNEKDEEYKEIVKMAEAGNVHAQGFLAKKETTKEKNRKLARQSIINISTGKLSSEELSTELTKLFDLIVTGTPISVLANLKPHELEIFAKITLDECKKSNLSMMDKGLVLNAVLTYLSSESLLKQELISMQDNLVQLISIERPAPSAPPLKELPVPSAPPLGDYLTLQEKEGLKDFPALYELKYKQPVSINSHGFFSSSLMPAAQAIANQQSVDPNLYVEEKQQNTKINEAPNLLDSPVPNQIKDEVLETDDYRLLKQLKVIDSELPEYKAPESSPTNRIGLRG